LHQRLRNVRDRLFEAGRQESLSFDDAAYEMTRQILNGMIQFAHDFSLWRLVFMVATEGFWSERDASLRFLARFNETTESLTPAGRVAVLAAMRDAHFAVLSHVAHTSLITFPLVMLAKVLVAISATKRVVLANVERVSQRALNAVDRNAYLVGSF
jgi:hypothetical protein